MKLEPVAVFCVSFLSRVRLFLGNFFDFRNASSIIRLFFDCEQRAVPNIFVAIWLHVFFYATRATVYIIYIYMSRGILALEYSQWVQNCFSKIKFPGRVLDYVPFTISILSSVPQIKSDSTSL